MHRLTTTTCCSVLFLAALVSCGGSKPPETPADKAKAEAAEGEAAEEADGEDADGEKAAPKKDVCTGFDIGNLEDLLAKSDCEVPDAKPETLENVEVKDKLEVKVTASPTRVAPGGKADLLVTFTNKTNQSMQLNFRIDPLARFETETYDSKKKRVDMPPGEPPPPPKGHNPPPPAEVKVARVTLAPNGSARTTVPWEAVKMKWAPEKVRGTAVERGYPRKPAGPLPKGKYTVRVMTPLIGVFEGGEHEISGPSVEIEVGN